MNSADSPTDRERALALIRRYGWNATSFQCLEPGIRYWFTGDGGACVAYSQTGNAWVAAGAPIAAEGRLAEAARAFHEAARASGVRVCFFATERRFVEASDWPATPIGEQPVWNPERWDQAIRSSRSLREQLRRSRSRGVTVRSVGSDGLTPSSELAAEIRTLIDRWHGSRSLPQMSFLVQVDLFHHPEERRIFVAEREGRLVGLLSLAPVYARAGWLFEDLLRVPEAPNGTTEMLVDAAMRAIAAEGSRYATLGLAPLSGEIPRWLRWVRRLGSRFYTFKGLRAFKEKLGPNRWEPIFLCYPPGQNAILTLFDAASAFAPEGPARFAAEALVRTPEPALKLLTGLLLPWTVLLATPFARTFFPSELVRWAWVAFDVGLLAFLVPLARRWTQTLAAFLVTVITADALLTLVQALLFNFRRPLSFPAALAIGVGLLGPTIAAVFLWGAWLNRRRRDEAAA